MNEMLRAAALNQRVSLSTKYLCLPTFVNSIWWPTGGRSFHGTPLLEFGRNDGNSATKAKPRDFSKAQKQRWRKKMALASKEKKHDGSAKLKGEQMINQISNPETEEFLNETGER